jgi:hypothetical protein
MTAARPPDRFVVHIPTKKGARMRVRWLSTASLTLALAIGIAAPAPAVEPSGPPPEPPATSMATTPAAPVDPAPSPSTTTPEASPVAEPPAEPATEPTANPRTLAAIDDPPADELLIRDLEVTGGLGRATVTWSPPSGTSSPVGYEAEVEGTSSRCTAAAEVTTCVLTGLPVDGRDVTVRARAIYADEVAGGWTATRVLGTRVTLAVSASVTAYAQPVTISGSVRSSDGVALAGLPVALQQRPLTTSLYTALAAPVSSATGGYAVRHQALRIVDLRAVVEGGLGRLGAVLTGKRVVVRSVASLVVSDRSIDLGDPVVLSGGIWPPRPNALISVQRYSGGAWRTVQAIRVDSGSRYRWVKPVMLPGNHAWRVLVPSTRVAIGWASPNLRVAVKAVPNVAVSNVTRTQVPYSWRPGCPVHYTRLRAVTVNHRDFSGGYRRGTIVVERRYADDVAAAFSNAFRQRFPIRSMIPIDAYYDGGRRSGVQADIASMAADNTSGFNCRGVVGHPKRMSAHSVGNAIDVNPRENPYVTGGTVYPKGSSSYLNRSNRRPGMLYSSGAIVKTLRGYGWVWGASIRDYHHLSRYGG